MKLLRCVGIQSRQAMAKEEKPAIFKRRFQIWRRCGGCYEFLRQFRIFFPWAKYWSFAWWQQQQQHQARLTLFPLLLLWRSICPDNRTFSYAILLRAQPELKRTEEREREKRRLQFCECRDSKRGPLCAKVHNICSHIKMSKKRLVLQLDMAGNTG